MFYRVGERGEFVTVGLREINREQIPIRPPGIDMFLSN